MADTDGVRKASLAFYAALNAMAKGNAKPMLEVWSRGEGVSTMHPVGGREVGWDQVQEPWVQIAALCTGGSVRLTDAVLTVSDELAFEVGHEDGTIDLAGHPVEIAHRVTNVYRREKSGWKIVHHHTDVSAAMLDALHGMTAAGARRSASKRPAGKKLAKKAASKKAARPAPKKAAKKASKKK